MNSEISERGVVFDRMTKVLTQLHVISMAHNDDEIGCDSKASSEIRPAKGLINAFSKEATLTLQGFVVVVV